MLAVIDLNLTNKYFCKFMQIPGGEPKVTTIRVKYAARPVFGRELDVVTLHANLSCFLLTSMACVDSWSRTRCSRQS